jgi:crotonobetainyl-CoA:carnitine CoA-transferase CaiB-like acyl-CoA transferase
MPIQSTGALSGLRVLDLGHAMAGPFCASLLADHGADVIKIEPPSGDEARHIGPFAADDSARAYGSFFQYCNRNKRGLVLDLKTEAGRGAFLKLVQGADILVENFRAGVMERLGLGYEALAEINPRLVYTAIRGFGDPRGGRTRYTDWPAADIIAQAMAGLMGVTGPAADEPTLVPAAPGDTVPGLFGAFASMVAAWNVARTGKGQFIDVSMADALLAMNDQVTTQYSYTGVVPRPSGSRVDKIVPFGRVRTKDGWAVIAVPPGRLWADFCEAIGRPDLITAPGFASPQDRVANKDAVYAEIEKFTATVTKAELTNLLGGKIPVGPIQDAHEINSDPYFAARQMIQKVEQPGSKHMVALPGVPTKLHGTPAGETRRAPLLGEHTDEVLAEFGFAAAEIDVLRAAGALG